MGRARRASNWFSTCRRQLRVRRRAEAGSRPPQAPAGSERSGEPGRGRARCHPHLPTEADDDPREYRPRRTPQAAASANARRVWRDLTLRAEQEGWSCRDFLALLVEEEIAHRQQTRLGRVSRWARFPFLKTIDDFDFTYQSVVRLSLLGSALSPDFVTEGRCIDPQRETWPRQDASRDRHCLSRHSERFRRALCDGRGTDR